MSSFVFASPDVVTSASQDLAGIGSALRQANAAAAFPTTLVVAAAQDEVSGAIAALFGNYGQDFQALNAQVAAFHEQFVQALNGSGFAYAAAEATNAAATAAASDPLTTLVDLAQPFGVFSPVELLTGRSLFVNGANATTPGGNGGTGGWLIGNGGNGAAGASADYPRRCRR